jgi:hypothetical protein
MRRLAGRATALGLVLLVATSCAHAAQVANDGSAPADAAQAHRAEWNAAGVFDYTWRVYVGCFCDSGTSVIEVVDGHPVDLRVDGKPSSIGSDREAGIIPLTMDDLSDVLDEAYAKHAQVVRVTYDQDLGYPTDILIDPDYGCPDPAPDGRSCVVADDDTAVHREVVRGDLIGTWDTRWT